MPYSPHGRKIVTVAYAAAYGLTAIAYGAFPPAQTRAGVVSIARYIDSLGPVWTVGFAVSAVALLVTAWWRRGEWIAHSISAAIVAGFGFASLASGFLSANFYGSPLGLICLATVVTHLLLARRYQQAPLSPGGRHVG